MKIMMLMIFVCVLFFSGCSSMRACTDEGKVCPDGSIVGRTGPNCEFTPCKITPCTDAKTFCESELQTVDGRIQLDQTTLENTFYQDKSCNDWSIQCKWYFVD